MTTTTDLTFIIDDIAGVGVGLAGQYADWTIETVEWWAASGGDLIPTGESLFTPATFSEGSYHAVVVASNPEQTETVTLASTNISGNETTRSGTIYRDIYVEGIDGDYQEATSSFGEHNPTGILFHSQFRDGAPNNIYVTEANGIFTEYQYDTTTGEQGYIAAEDREDVMDWTYLTSYFSGGDVSRTEEVRDDGVVIDDSFYMGVITESVTIDHLDAHDYQIILDFYQNGVLAISQEQLDNGRQTTRNYVNGELESMFVIDAGDAYNYSDIVNFYDGEGGREQSILYDDGRELNRTFVPQEDGTGTRIDSWTMTDAEDAHSWTTQERLYDENNELSLSYVVADDGATTFTNYEAGVRVNVQINDEEDARNYTSIERHYEEGVIAAELKQLDDGRENTTLYDSEGQRSTFTTVDTADAFVWAEQTRTYDENGDSVLFRVDDDGLEITTLYLGNVKVESFREDVGDTRAWHSIEDQFEDGVRVSREIIWDSDLIV